ncbi:MAG: thiamine pyrophosphate-binding protein [Bacteroidota bacterium]
MKVSSHIAKFLFSKGIDTVFELSGGMITHMLDEISKENKIQIISCHHEQSAAFAADGYARVKQLPGVAFATSGPGATNLLTGIGSCFFDSVPAIFITGQVNINEQKKKLKIRQLGFQETDIVSMAKPITKSVYSISNPNEIPRILEMAFRISLEGRPGPVLIDIPMNIQRMEISTDELLEEQINVEMEISGMDKYISKFVKALRISKKPLILCGRGIRASHSLEIFQEINHQLKIPVVTSLLGLDVLSFSDNKRIGFIGTYGNRWANIALGECDLLLVLGCRLDIRQTGADVDFFALNKRIFHIDVESGEINNRIKGCEKLVSDLNYFLNYSKDKFKSIVLSVPDWLSYLDKIKLMYLDTNELAGCKGINPNEFIKKLSTSNNNNAKAYTADVGNHQMWTAQSLRLKNNQYFLTSGGMGAMGFALPASIGACFALKKLPIVCITGDGSLQINIQELQTIVRNKLPIKIIVLNNNSLGMIRQFQDSYFDSRYQSTVWGYDAPDFEKVAKAYGISSATLSDVNDLDKVNDLLWSNSNEPYLLQVIIDSKVNVHPKIAFGRPITQMEPDFKPIEIEGT